jgi:hypothetical protein
MTGQRIMKADVALSLATRLIGSYTVCESGTCPRRMARYRRNTTVRCNDGLQELEADHDQLSAGGGYGPELGYGDSELANNVRRTAHVR